MSGLTRRPTGGRKRTWASSRVRPVVLESYAITGDSTPCRVCGRALRVGDHVLSRTWHAGFSCCACGWFTLEDLRFEDAWGAAMRGSSLSVDEVAKLTTLGLLVVVDAATKKIAWTETGKRLRDEWRAARGAA